MNEKQLKLLEHYRSLWVELNAVNALRDDLEKQAADIKAKQRQIANKIAKLGIAGSEEEYPATQEEMAEALGARAKLVPFSTPEDNA